MRKDLGVLVLAPVVLLLSVAAMAEVRESTGFVEAHDGTRLFYRKLGDGPQKIIVPGGFLFYRAFDRFASPERTVIFYDMRNRGRSDALKDLSQATIQNDVRDLESVRAHFGVEKATLVGYSYLGFMVVLYAMEHPEQVERMVQLGPVARQWGTKYPAQFTNPDREQVLDKKGRDELQELEQQGYDVSHPREYCEKDWKVFRRLLVGKAENAEKLPGWCDLPNEWPVNLGKHIQASFGWVQALKVSKEEVAKVTVPVLTIHGTKDRNTPYGSGREWASTLPNARLITVKGAAHQSWEEEPDLVLGSMETFLRGDWPEEAEKIPSLEGDGNGSPGEPGEAGKPLEKELIELEKQSWEAWKRQDGSFFQAFLSDDHVELGSGGRSDKAAVASFVAKNLCVVKSYSLDSFRVTAFTEDTALVTYHAEQDTTCNGQPVPSPAWVSSLYIKRSGRWSNALYQQTQASKTR